MIRKETCKKIKYFNKYVKNVRRIEFALLFVIDFIYKFDLIYLKVEFGLLIYLKIYFILKFLYKSNFSLYWTIDS